MRETFWKLTGGEADRTPLDIGTTGEVERRAYRVEKLIYESRPGLHITANLHGRADREDGPEDHVFILGRGIEICEASTSR